MCPLLAVVVSSHVGTDVRVDCKYAVSAARRNLEAFQWEKNVPHVPGEA
jgi:hypothetical protein